MKKLDYDIDQRSKTTRSRINSSSPTITYYKKRAHIHKTINSILNQTYKSFEIIFVYDDEDNFFLSDEIVKVESEVF